MCVCCYQSSSGTFCHSDSVILCTYVCVNYSCTQFLSVHQLKKRKEKMASKQKAFAMKKAKEDAKLNTRIQKERKEFYRLLGQERRHKT